MSGLSVTRSLFICACLATALAGCKKAEAPPSPALDSSGSTSSSVAAPSSAMPASEATTAPTTTPDSSDAANTPQSTPAELSKQQESSAMPMPGQVNNHSTATPNEEKK